MPMAATSSAYGAQQVLYLLHLLFGLLKCVLKGTGAVPHIVYGGLHLGYGVGAFALYHYAVVILGVKLHVVAVFLGELLHRLYIHKAVPRKLVVAWGYDAYGVYAVGLAGGRLAIAVARQNRIIIVVNVVIVEGELELRLHCDLGVAVAIHRLLAGIGVVKPVEHVLAEHHLIAGAAALVLGVAALRKLQTELLRYRAVYGQYAAIGHPFAAFKYAVGLYLGHNGFYAGYLFDGLDRFFVQLFLGAGAARGGFLIAPAADGNICKAAHAGIALHRGFSYAYAEAHHDDYRGNTDDHAQHSEHGSKLSPPQVHEGGP